MNVKCSETLGWYSQQQSPYAFAICNILTECREKYMKPRHKSHLFHDLMYLTHPADQSMFDLMNEIRRENLSEGQFQPRKFSNAGR